MMKRVLAAAVVAVMAVACSSSSSDSSSDLENGQRGPGAIHPGWFKSPEAISETVTRTWGLELTEAEELQYIAGLRASLGGVSVAQQGSLVDRPHELFVLATHSLSAFLAEKLIAKQVEKTAAGEMYLFDGLGFAVDDDGCYADDSKEWCDGKDGLTIGSLEGVNAAEPLTKDQRKRLMHKMQAIGEFFLMAIDERTKMPGQADKHAPAYLLDEVFLPKLAEAGGTERLAWQEVVTTILMSGYFFDLPADE